MTRPKFRFTISDLGLMLGKSPVTIRGWERKGMLTLPRIGANRALTIAQVREVAGTACEAGRITVDRRQIINEAMTSLAILEQEKK